MILNASAMVNARRANAIAPKDTMAVGNAVVVLAIVVLNATAAMIVIVAAAVISIVASGPRQSRSLSLKPT